MINYEYLRRKKGKVLKDWYDQGLQKRATLNAWSGLNATILPLKKNNQFLFGNGGVIDANGKYVQISAIEKRVQGNYPIEKEPIYKDEKVVYCGYLVPHWGHFLIEAVSRLWYFLQNDSTIDRYVFFIEENKKREIQGNYKEFFELLGVWNRIDIINQPTQYREVIVPELGYKRRAYYSDAYLKIFDQIAESIQKGEDWVPADKIYMSRSQLNDVDKREFGLDMLDDYFRRNGYEVIFPEKMSLSQMIFLLRNAKTVAAISGSLPHNLLFAQNEKPLIIVERNVLNNEIQVDVDHMKELDVIYIDANLPVYSINIGYGPFIMYYTDEMRRFTEDNNYVEPDQKYQEERLVKKYFSKYLKAYKKAYRYQWFLEDWSERYIDYIREGYKDGYKILAPYLTGMKPVFWWQNFQPEYIKKKVKAILRK